jgi:hypothetical protein
MVTDEEVEAAACPFCGGPARTFRYNGAAQAQCAKVEQDYCAGIECFAPVALWNRRAPNAEAARKPDLVPGLEMARRIVRESDFLVEADDAITLAIEVVTSPSPEHPVDDDALVRRLDGLPQP